MTRITLSLDDEVARQLSDSARKAGMSEAEFVRLAIVRLLQSQHGPAVPRFARHLGPLS